MHSLLNLKPLFFYLSIRYNPTDLAIIRGFHNRPELVKLRPSDFNKHLLSYDYCVKKTEEMLKKNISSIKEKKVAIGLSGGTDSSLNTIFLSKNENIDLKCFCVGFGDTDDEFKDARTVAKLANCELKEIIIDNIMKDLPLLIWKFGAPKSNLWPYYNFKIVKQLGASTTLSGEGGDELFGGYYFRYKKYLEKIPRIPFERAKWYIFARTREWVPNQYRMFGKRFKEKRKLVVGVKDLVSHFLSAFDNNLSYLNQIFLADFNYKLRYDFNFVDSVFATTEKVKLESPFLKSNIINFATHIPSQFKVGKNTSKMILRDILKRNGAPEHIYNKPKQGWGMKPTTIWKSDLGDKCREFLLDGNLVRDGWINREWLKETISIIEKNKNVDSENTHRYVNKIWDVLSFEIFYIQRVLGESKHGKISNW